MYDICVITTIHQRLDARITDRGIRFYTEAGLRTAVICPWEYAPDTGVERKDWIQTTPARHRAQRIRLDWETYHHARRTPALVYHFHDFDFLPWAVLLHRRLRRPVVYDCHENYPEDTLYHKPWIFRPLRLPLSLAVRALENWGVRRLKNCIVVVPSLTDRFRRLGVEPILIRNFSRLEPQPELPHDLALLYAGSISEFYGADTLLDVARVLKRRGEPYPLIVPDRFSSVMLRARFTRAVEREGLPVKVVPQVPPRELHRLMRLGAIGLVTDQNTPTMAHGMHAKFFDYMASGLPMVAGDLPNAHALIQSAKCGVLVEPENAEAFVDAATALLRDPVQREVFRQNGFRAFGEEYSWRAERDRLLAYVRDLGAASTPQ